MNNIDKEQELKRSKFLVRLQLEYLSAYYRSKLYFNKKDKEYYSKLKTFKIEKIIDLSKKLNKRNMFTSERILKYYLIYFENSGFMPKLTNLTKQDCCLYFHKNVKVLTKFGIGVVSDYVFERNLVEITINEEIHVLNQDEVKRLIPIRLF